MTQQTYKPVWNLENIFPGGSTSPAFAAEIAQLTTDIAALQAAVKGPATAASLRTWYLTIQDLAERLAEAASFIGCHVSANVKDEQAKQGRAQTSQLSAQLGAAWIALDQHSLQMTDAAWAELLADPDLAPIAYVLNRRRSQAREKLPPDQETLASALGVDGYHAWGELYTTLVGRMTIPFEQDGVVKQLSVGQASNKLRDDDRSVRSTMFGRLQEAWAREAELCAGALNHLTGYRLALYKQRGWASVLKEPLSLSRVSEATINTMWHVINQNKAPLVQYLNRKAAVLGLERLSPYDVGAALGRKGAKRTWDEGAAFVVEQFASFSPVMADFATRAFAGSWIEAEDRPGKAPGGYHTRMPRTGESRIFMTYDGSAGTVATLAHELGHGFHSHVLQEVPFLVRNYGMSLAETASTFAEMLVSDAAMKATTDPQERLALVDDKLQRTVAFFMNIHARFLFDSRYHAARAQGVLTVEEISRLAVAAQEEAYAGALAEYSPYIWASTLHYYLSGQPFYNFPYTFGYLFSAGIYAQALAEGPGFAAKYVALLQDTGRMDAEEVAARHLGVDLTQPEFWQRAVDVVLADVAEFLALTAER